MITTYADAQQAVRQIRTLGHGVITSQRRLLDDLLNHIAAQEATIAHLREEAEHWQALWKGEADRAQAMEEELTKVTEQLTKVKYDAKMSE